jgi:outer membrane protein assembly factor BamB
MKLHLFLAVGLLMLLSGCTSSEKESKTENATVLKSSTPSLVGQTIEYRYGESVYHVTIDSDSTLHWEAMTGDEKGAFERETYVSEWIESNILFISWGEANGINVSQVLDFNKGIVYNHLIRNREASMGQGKIKILSE